MKKEYNPKHKITGEETVTTKPKNRRENTTHEKSLLHLPWLRAMTLSLADMRRRIFQQRSSIHRHDGHGIPFYRRIHGLLEAEDTITVMVPPSPATI